MELFAELGERRFRIDLRAPRPIAIPLNFSGQQPLHFGVERASATTVAAGSFLGDTSRGGSCNVRRLTLIPHCNGTHTETIAHIVDEQVPVGELVQETLCLALVVSVNPVPVAESGETCLPAYDPEDLVISRASLERGIGGQTPLEEVNALVVRTLPNHPWKRFLDYASGPCPPYLTTEAVKWIAESGIRHLLVDIPSIDRARDGGLLGNHRLFWGVEAGTHQAGPAARRERTITELIYVDDDIADGVYMLDLQVSPFAEDAAPSRPILYPLIPAGNENENRRAPKREEGS